MSVHAVVAVLQILIRPGDYSLSGGEEKPMSFGIRRRQILTPPRTTVAFARVVVVYSAPVEVKLMTRYFVQLINVINRKRSTRPVS